MKVIDIEKEKEYYAKLGVDESNVYLHVRGHNIYDLLKSMGKQVCSAYHINFENDVLNNSLPKLPAYWELKKVSDDLKIILT